MRTNPTTRSVVVFTTYPSSDASRRLRIDPVVGQLRARNISVIVDTLLPDWLFRRKNQGFVYKILGAVTLCFTSLRRAWRIAFLRRTTRVLVHREAFPFLTPLVERLLALRVGKFALDIDDAVHLQPTHGRDWRRFLRKADRALETFQFTDLVLAGSPEMQRVAGEAGALHSHLAMTTPPRAALDAPLRDKRENRLLWTGSQSTLPSLLEVLPEVLAACERTGLTLAVLGGTNVWTLPRHPALTVNQWTSELELQELGRCSIGIMPLPDSPWERGKSSYKALLYMASGVLPVVSPVGMNNWLAEQCPAVVVAQEAAWRTTLETLLANADVETRRRECRAWALGNLDAEVNARSVASLLVQ